VHFLCINLACSPTNNSFGKLTSIARHCTTWYQGRCLKPHRNAPLVNPHIACYSRRVPPTAATAYLCQQFSSISASAKTVSPEFLDGLHNIASADDL
jgi:hypothetical protein